MQKKQIQLRKHVHTWEQFYPKIDQQLGNYLGLPVIDTVHVYRKCECGLREKVKTIELHDFPESMRLYADVSWEETDQR